MFEHQQRTAYQLWYAHISIHFYWINFQISFLKIIINKKSRLCISEWIYNFNTQFDVQTSKTLRWFRYCAKWHHQLPIRSHHITHYIINYQSLCWIRYLVQVLTVKVFLGTLIHIFTARALIGGGRMMTWGLRGLQITEWILPTSSRMSSV